jgi:thioredoxin 1
MKKLAIYLSIIVALFAILYFINQQSEKAKSEQYSDEAEQLYSVSPDQLDPATRGQLNDPDYQNIILPEELKAKQANQEDFFVYFFSPTCVFCVATTPHLNDIAAEAGAEVHQYNLLEFTQGWSEYGIESTPTLVYFEDGKAADSIVGGYTGTNAAQDEQTAADYKQFFDQYTAE